MFEILKTVHLLSIGMVALAVSNAILGPMSARAPDAAQPTIASVMKLFGRIGRAGLLLLWISGLWMVFDRYGGNFGAMPTVFHWKLAFVVLATIGIVVMDYSPLRFRPGVVPVLGLASDLALAVVVVLAVVAFD